MKDDLVSNINSNEIKLINIDFVDKRNNISKHKTQKENPEIRETIKIKIERMRGRKRSKSTMVIMKKSDKSLKVKLNDGVRRDNYGNEIIKGSSKHKIAFLDKVSSKSLVDYVNIPKREVTDGTEDAKCKCIIF